MSGVIVPFETREVRDARLAAGKQNEPELTPEERLARYEQHTVIICRKLLQHYKQTQRWNTDCENEMMIAVTSLKNICRLLAATTPEVPV
jgi:hypothetical protein